MASLGDFGWWVNGVSRESWVIRRGSHFDASTTGRGNWPASGGKGLRNHGLGNVMLESQFRLSKRILLLPTFAARDLIPLSLWLGPCRGLHLPRRQPQNQRRIPTFH